MSVLPNYDLLRTLAVTMIHEASLRMARIDSSTVKAVDVIDSDLDLMFIHSLVAHLDLRALLASEDNVFRKEMHNMRYFLDKENETFKCGWRPRFAINTNPSITGL